MARTPTISNNILEWEEKAVSPDGNNLIITLELDAVDSGSGFVQEDKESSNVSWLDFSPTSTVFSDGSRETIVSVKVDVNGISGGNDYRFELSADDGEIVSTRKVTLSVLSGPGPKFFINGDTDDYIYSYELSSSWDLSSASFTGNNFDLQAQGVTIFQSKGLHFRPNGEQFYVADPTGTEEKVNAYDVSTAWDITTASYSKSLDVSSEETDLYDLFIKPDGSELFTTGFFDVSTVYSYNLSTPWDIGTASFTGNTLDLSDEDENFVTSIFFRDNGDTMWTLGGSDEKIYEYSFGSSWDLSSASFTGNTFDYSSEVDDNSGFIFFKPDGSKIFMTTPSADTVVEYGLGTNWDITTASVNNILDVSSETTAPRGIFFEI